MKKRMLMLLVAICLVVFSLSVNIFATQNHYNDFESVYISGITNRSDDIMNDDNWLDFCYILDRWYGAEIDFNNYFQLAYEFVIKQVCYTRSSNYIDNDPKGLLNFSCFIDGETVDTILKTNFGFENAMINRLHSDIYTGQYGNEGYYHDGIYYFNVPEGTLQGMLYSIDVIEKRNNLYKINFVNNYTGHAGETYYCCIFEIINSGHEESFKIHAISNYDVEIDDSPAPSPTTTTSFGATVSEWAAPEIEEAFENNLVPEVMLDFDLTEKVNRGEFAAIAVQLYETLVNRSVEESKNCTFVDIKYDVNEKAIKKAYQIDIAQGTSSTTYEPLSFINREQLATMLCRVIKKYSYPEWTMESDDDYYMDTTGVKKFADDMEISEWAKPSVYFMSKFGIVKGISDTHFAPKNTTTYQEASGYASATREQAIILAQRIFKISDMWAN